HDTVHCLNRPANSRVAVFGDLSSATAVNRKNRQAQWVANEHDKGHFYAPILGRVPPAVFVRAGSASADARVVERRRIVASESSRSAQGDRPRGAHRDVPPDVAV